MLEHTNKIQSNLAKLFSFKHHVKMTLLSLHRFNGVYCRTTWVSRYQKCKISLDLNEARDDGSLGYIGIGWTIRKQPAPRSIQITTPTPHHSIFYRPDALSDAQPTMSKH